MSRQPKPLAVLPFPTPLLKGRLLGRYNRFLADVRLDDGTIVTAHCVNTGRMEGLTMPGMSVWLSEVTNPKAQLRYRWELAEVDGVIIGTNTSAPNRCVSDLLRQQLLEPFQAEEILAEFRINAHSRVDFLLKQGAQHHYLEVKNCHLVYPDGGAYFPDSVSDRAAKHLRELSQLVSEGHRASVLFFAQREDAKFVRPSEPHDPTFAQAARDAAAAGVSFFALRIAPCPVALTVLDFIPVDVAIYDPTKPRQWMELNRALAPAWTRNPPARD